MRKTIDPGRVRRSINFIDNICYSKVQDLDGRPMDLKMSIMIQNGNSEMRLASGLDDEPDETLHPVVVWIPGGGFRGCDKNLMVSEMQFLAEAGYAVASIYYRSSAEGHFPDQIIDVKTAIRFLRAHASEYQLDTEKIAVIGRSAGGYLSALAAMNTSNYESDEWKEYSSDVQSCCDLFGPADLAKMMRHDLEQMKRDPNHRWKTIADSHAGALIGEDGPVFWERLEAAGISHHINPGMCPLVIMHGDSDPLVSVEQSEEFYELLKEKGFGDKADLYILKNGGHGTREFFQEETKAIILSFFDSHLR